MPDSLDSGPARHAAVGGKLIAFQKVGVIKKKEKTAGAQRCLNMDGGTYRGTSLIRNSPPP